MAKIKDLTGERFGQLLVLKYKGSANNNSTWDCVCDCGNIKTFYANNLKGGTTKSCGHKKITSSPEKDVCILKGYVTIDSDLRTVEYTTWAHMKSRCYNKKNKNYKNYGGRGITICDEWKECFFNFLSDMGLKPTPQHSIERIENNKGYYKENCKWAVMLEQQNNRRSNHHITLNGETHTLAQWCRIKKLRYDSVKKRIKIGWNPQDAFEIPFTQNIALSIINKSETLELVNS